MLSILGLDDSAGNICSTILGLDDSAGNICSSLCILSGPSGDGVLSCKALSESRHLTDYSLSLINGPPNLHFGEYNLHIGLYNKQSGRLRLDARARRAEELKSHSKDE
jgi:hypothetical protein